MFAGRSAAATFVDHRPVLAHRGGPKSTRRGDGAGSAYGLGGVIGVFKADEGKGKVTEPQSLRKAWLGTLWRGRSVHTLTLLMSDGALAEGVSVAAEATVTASGPGAPVPAPRVRSLSTAGGPEGAGTIVLLYANTGGGHLAAAEAVARDIARLGGDRFTVSLVDPAGTSSSRLIRWGARIYGPMTRRTPRLWGCIFHASNSAFAVALLRRTLLRPRRLVAASSDSLPLAVVSFHPLLTHIAVASPRCGPAITVVTDMVTIHRSWACAGVDTVVAPSAAAGDRLGAYGIAASAIVDAGLPVARPFLDMAEGDTPRARLRRKLGLAPGFVVLLFGGGEGSGGLVRQARALLARCPGVTVAAICGRNTAAQARLDGMATSQQGRLVVGGFVDNVEEWMMASDVVATKAGPGVIAEALVCGKPLLLTGHLPGQERGNGEWVVAHGAGVQVRRTYRLVDAVLALRDDPAGVAAMAERARQLARPEASGAIAELVVSSVRRAAALRR